MAMRVESPHDHDQQLPPPIRKLDVSYSVKFRRDFRLGTQVVSVTDPRLSAANPSACVDMWLHKLVSGLDASARVAASKLSLSSAWRAQQTHTHTHTHKIYTHSQTNTHVHTRTHTHTNRGNFTVSQHLTQQLTDRRIDRSISHMTSDRLTAAAHAWSTA